MQRLDAGLAQLPHSGALEGEVLTQLMERVLLLCSVEQMERCAEGLTATALEPVMTQDTKLVAQLSAISDTEPQEEPVIEKPAVVPEETSTAATFYF